MPRRRLNRSESAQAGIRDKNLSLIDEAIQRFFSKTSDGASTYRIYALDNAVTVSAWFATNGDPSFPMGLLKFTVGKTSDSNIGECSSDIYMPACIEVSFPDYSQEFFNRWIADLTSSSSDNNSEGYSMKDLWCIVQQSAKIAKENLEPISKKGDISKGLQLSDNEHTGGAIHFDPPNDSSASVTRQISSSCQPTQLTRNNEASNHTDPQGVPVISSHLGLIMGIAAGGGSLVLLVCVSVYYYLKRRNNKASKIGDGEVALEEQSFIEPVYTETTETIPPDSRTSPDGHHGDTSGEPVYVDMNQHRFAFPDGHHGDTSGEPVYVNMNQHRFAFQPSTCSPHANIKENSAYYVPKPGAHKNSEQHNGKQIMGDLPHCPTCQEGEKKFANLISCAQNLPSAKNAVKLNNLISIDHIQSAEDNRKAFRDLMHNASFPAKEEVYDVPNRLLKPVPPQKSGNLLNTQGGEYDVPNRLLKPVPPQKSGNLLNTQGGEYDVPNRLLKPVPPQKPLNLSQQKAPSTNEDLSAPQPPGPQTSFSSSSTFSRADRRQGACI